MSVTTNADNYTLRQKQALFARLIAQLISWIYTHPSWEVTLSEGYVGDTDARDGDYDGPHMRGGAHYKKLALDMNLFVDGKWITGGSEAWDEIGEKWKGLHPLCRWGGDFKSRDFNHFSLFHEGKA